MSSFSTDDLDGILARAEDMADIRAAEDVRGEIRATGEAPIRREQVKVDLGLEDDIDGIGPQLN